MNHWHHLDTPVLFIVRHVVTATHAHCKVLWLMSKPQGAVCQNWNSDATLF